MSGFGGIGGGLLGNRLANKYNKKYHSPSSPIFRNTISALKDNLKILSLAKDELGKYEPGFQNFLQSMGNTYGSNSLSKIDQSELPNRINAIIDGIGYRDLLKNEVTDAIKSKFESAHELERVKNVLRNSAKKTKMIGLGTGIGAGVIGGALVGALVSKMLKKTNKIENLPKWPVDSKHPDIDDLDRVEWVVHAKQRNPSLVADENTPWNQISESDKRILINSFYDKFKKKYE